MFTIKEAIERQLKADGATDTQKLLMYVREQATDYAGVESFDEALQALIESGDVLFDSIIDAKVYWEWVGE